MSVSALTLSSPFANVRALPVVRSPFADPSALAHLRSCALPSPASHRYAPRAHAHDDVVPQEALSSEASLRDWISS